MSKPTTEQIEAALMCMETGMLCQDCYYNSKCSGGNVPMRDAIDLLKAQAVRISELEAATPHAHWIRDGEGAVKCSCCSYGWIDHGCEDNADNFVEEAEYCFSCGAKMDEEVEDETD